MVNNQFIELLYTQLLANCPKDTRNHVNNIMLVDYETYVKIIISAPKMDAGEFYDYARDVNYNQKRTAKEARNYEWIERTIRQVSEAIGGNVQYELS